MDYRRLGHSGLKVSALALGSWITFGGALDRGGARRLVAHAYDAGISLFDSAENYAGGLAEEWLGDVIADLRLPRDAICLSSKAFFGAAPDPRPTQRGLSRKHLRDACDAALARLRTDYLDLFFCHRPDPETPVEETVAAMDLLVRTGKVLYWGTSEWPAELIRSALRCARTNGLTTWSPLASGLLSGKYAQGRIPEGSRRARRDHGWHDGVLPGASEAARDAAVARLADLADALDATPAALAIAWCLRNPKVSSVILGCSSTAQLDANLAALALAQRLDPGTLARLDALADD